MRSRRALLGGLTWILLAAACLQFVGCGIKGDSNGTPQSANADPNQANRLFFETTKADVAERLKLISNRVGELGVDFPQVGGDLPSLSRESSFVVAADAVDSFVWWLQREGGGIIPLEHVDAVGNDNFFSGLKIENYRVAKDSGSYSRGDYGIMQSSKHLGLSELKQIHAGLMGSHVILTRKKLLEEVVVTEIETSADLEFTGGPMNCQILVLDIESMKPVYSTSFIVESVQEMKINSGGKVLKSAQDRVMHSFHSEANKQFAKRIAGLFN